MPGLALAALNPSDALTQNYCDTKVSWLFGALSPEPTTKDHIRAGKKLQIIPQNCAQVIKPQSSLKSTKVVLTQMCTNQKYIFVAV